MFILLDYNIFIWEWYSRWRLIFRQERVEEYIKKVKKNYEKEYIVYDMETYINDELQYYIDDEDITQEYILYEEMLEEVRTRDTFLDITSYDHEHYYTYYDFEAKYYQSDLVPLL